jgi:hypothetical protein
MTLSIMDNVRIRLYEAIDEINLPEFDALGDLVDD